MEVGLMVENERQRPILLSLDRLLLEMLEEKPLVFLYLDVSGILFYLLTYLFAAPSCLSDCCLSFLTKILILQLSPDDHKIFTTPKKSYKISFLPGFSFFIWSFMSCCRSLSWTNWIFNNYNYWSAPYNFYSFLIVLGP